MDAGWNRSYLDAHCLCAIRFHELLLSKWATNFCSKLKLPSSLQVLPYRLQPSLRPLPICILTHACDVLFRPKEQIPLMVNSPSLLSGIPLLARQIAEGETHPNGTIWVEITPPPTTSVVSTQNGHLALASGLDQRVAGSKLSLALSKRQH